MVPVFNRQSQGFCCVCVVSATIASHGKDLAPLKMNTAATCKKERIGAGNKSKETKATQMGNIGNCCCSFVLHGQRTAATAAAAGVIFVHDFVSFRFALCFGNAPLFGMRHLANSKRGRGRAVGSENDLPVWCQVMRRPWGAAAALQLQWAEAKKIKKRNVSNCCNSKEATKQHATGASTHQQQQQQQLRLSHVNAAAAAAAVT